MIEYKFDRLILVTNFLSYKNDKGEWVKGTNKSTFSSLKRFEINENNGSMDWTNIKINFKNSKKPDGKLKVWVDCKLKYNYEGPTNWKSYKGYRNFKTKCVFKFGLYVNANIIESKKELRENMTVFVDKMAFAKTEENGAIWANQFDNVANRQAHYENTGPEIFEQTEGKVDAFICAVGTGGTLAGTGMSLKECNSDIIIALADPLGASLHSFYTTGEFSSWGESITEGIGQGRITANLEDAPVDLSFQISDEEALPICFDLLKEEGLCLGGSSGINVAGAIRLAKEIGPGKTMSPSSATPGSDIKPSFSIRNIYAKKTYRFRNGWNN